MNCQSCGHDMKDHNNKGCWHVKGNYDGVTAYCYCEKTEHEIENAQLRALLVEAREAIKPFADADEAYYMGCSYSDFRRVAELYQRLQKAGE